MKIREKDAGGQGSQSGRLRSADSASHLTPIGWVRTAEEGTSCFNDSGMIVYGEMMMPNQRVFAMQFANVYPMYVAKAERKGRKREDVDRIICWLTGYDQAGLRQQIEQKNDIETFFAQAPAIHPNCSLIKGVVCGIRVEEVADPLMRKVRYLDKLIDELAKGRKMEKILRE